MIIQILPDLPGKEDVMSMSETEEERRSWTRDRDAKRRFFSIFTAFYALVIVVYLFIVETSQSEVYALLSSTRYYMFSLSIIFLLYCNLFIVYPWYWNVLTRKFGDWRLLRNAERFHIEPARHKSEGVGTLYLRLGALLFGCGAVVLCGLEVFLAVRDPQEGKLGTVENVLAAIFIFLQMHFMNVHFNISFSSSYYVCKAGLMHLVAANLWTWMKHVIAKLNHREELKDHILGNYTSSEEDSSSSEENEELTTILLRVTTSIPSPSYDQNKIPGYEIINAFNHFGDLVTFLDTCVVEFSLIAAAVMYIMWRQLDHGDLDRFGKKKRNMRVDCRSTTKGLYCGVIMLILACISMGIYSVFQKENNMSAYVVFGVFELLVLSSSLLVCSIAIVRIRHLEYRSVHHGETLDEILLFIGLVGQLASSASEIDLFINGYSERHEARGFVFSVAMVRIAQVVVQSFFILMASRLAVSANRTRLWGRQCTTFLLVTNVTMFAFLIYESMSEGFGWDGPRESNYYAIRHFAEPMCIFYRFHSSVCLADVWKRTYSEKANGHDSEATSPTHDA